MFLFFKKKVDNCNFTGSIPSQLGSLTDLELLYLWNNTFTGTLFTEYGRLSRLRGTSIGLFFFFFFFFFTDQNNLYAHQNPFHSFILGINNLSGTLPSELGRLVDVEHLHVDNNHFHSTLPSELGLLTQLSSLCMYSIYYYNRKVYSKQY